MHDLQQARQFVKALTGSPDTVVTFQAFYDPKDGESPKGIAQVWHSTIDASADFITYKQSQLAGIYVCINGTDGKGREIYNVNNLRVLFADHDGQIEPTWKIPPHFTQQRDPLHGHAFWLIEAGDLTNDEWSILQKQIALFYGTDEQVVDPCRVARLAGTLHLKDKSAPAAYRITTDNTAHLPKYTIEQIRQAHILPADKDAVLNQWAEARQGINTGVGYEDNEAEISKFIGFISNAAHPAVLGSGTHELYRVACYGHDHGVSLEKAKELLWIHYNPRCLPPWTDDERHHFDGIIYRGYHYSKSAAGCKTAKAAFMALPPMPEPNCGWDKQAEQFNAPVTLTAANLTVTKPVINIVEGEEFRFDHRLSSSQALVMAAQLTVKSSHYDFSCVFDGVNYHGVRLVRCQEQFYEYNGKSWAKVGDDVIKASVQRAFSIYRPPAAFTSGIFNCLVDHVNVRSVENGTWLSDRETSTGNYTIFSNGIVDLNSADLRLIPHTPEFFGMNELSHNYNPDAKCPRFLEFLTSIWDDNEDMKMQLQEWLGYCLTNDVSLQKFAAFVGKSRGGKGTIVNILMAMVGARNIASPTLDNLATNSALAEMSSKSLVLIPDAHNVENNSRNKVLSTMKAITGCDPVSFHELYKGGRNMIFKCKLVLSTNNVPEFKDPSGALVNRLLVFPFYRSFAGRENFDLSAQLAAEIEGITQWAIEGLRRLRANKGKFTEGKLGLVAKEEIRKDMFELAEFIESSCELDSSEFTLLDDLYNAYRLWSATQGIKLPLTKTQFNKTLRNSALPITHDAARGKGFTGITVKSAFASTNVMPFAPMPTGNVQ